MASFYSDLASIDTNIENNVTTVQTSDTNTKTISDNVQENTTDATKKKKRKIKKLQPWRSGNLETWISKWQKAQKELEG